MVAVCSPPNNPWNQPVDREPVDPASDLLIGSIGKHLPLHPDFGSVWRGKGTIWRGIANGIPYTVVPGDTPRVPVVFEYEAESDPGPYPIPINAPIEGGVHAKGDRHILVVDRDQWHLYELFSAYPDPSGWGWRAGSGAIFDLKSNQARPAGWTSADAAGLPIFPGLIRYDEVVEQRAIRHALRFTVKHTRRAYVPPARHWASCNKVPYLPPMGMRVRLKGSYNISGFPPSAQVILQALKTYGMLLADNGGDWFLSGAPDRRWSDSDIAALAQVTGKDFEVVLMKGLVAG